MSTVRKLWTVIGYEAAGAGPGLDWFESRAVADAEAVAKAGRNPGRRYVVLEIVGTVLVDLPGVEEIR